MQNYKIKLIQLTLWLAFATTFISGQNPRSVETVIAIQNIGVSSYSGETQNAVESLKRENLTQTADTKPLDFFDFSFDGKTNCPLTIIVNIKFAPNGALRYLEVPRSLKSEGKTGKCNSDNSLVDVLCDISK